ncbi:MAG TPA: hypothetical protein VER35_03015, partial [Candidatus Limnocylindrales bacterium]|nr:hypothetical protein [Candidatus Limnocylindrales bacterium]
MESKNLIKLDGSNQIEWTRLILNYSESQDIDQVLLFDSFRDYYYQACRLEIQKAYLGEIRVVEDNPATSAADKRAAKIVIREKAEYKDDLKKWEEKMQKEHEKWDVKDKQARSLLKAYVEDSFKSQLDKDTIKTARDMWKSLLEDVQKSQGGARFSAYFDFITLNYNGEKLIDYLTKKQVLFEKMNKLDVLMPEDIAFIDIVTRLPVRFTILKQAMHRLKKDEMVLSMLRAEFSSNDYQDRNDQTMQEEKKKYEEANQVQIRNCSNCKKILPSTFNLKFHRCSDCQGEHVKKFPPRRANNNNNSKKENANMNEEKKNDKPPTKKEEAHSTVFAMNVNEQERERSEEDLWYLDSGASVNLTFNLKALNNPKKSNVLIAGPLRDGKMSRAKAEGEVVLKVENEREVVLNRVIYDENMRRNLMSVKELTKNNDQSVLFFDDKFLLLDRTPNFEDSKILMSGKVDHTGLYAVSKSIDPNGIVHSNSTRVKTSLTLLEWHIRLGHLSMKKILELIDNGILESKKVRREDNDESHECEICSIAKQRRTNFARIKSSPVEDVGDLIHSDLCGPITPFSLGNNAYFITFIDDKSDFLILNLMSKKSGTLDTLKNTREWVKTQTGKRIKSLLSDGGGEFTGDESKDYMKEKGIVPVTTPP